jgi:hypothetical protein
MPQTNRIWISSLALALIASPLGAQIRPRQQTTNSAPVYSRPIDALRWLTGCWERRLIGTTQQENWGDGSGDTMLGFGKIVRNGAVFDLEFVRIYTKGDQLVYEAHPMNQTPAEFTALPPFGYTITFSNPQHDYPQRIIYRRITQDSIVARIEGRQNGRTRGTDFPYARKACN